MRLGVHLVTFNLPGGPETIGPTLAATRSAVHVRPASPSPATPSAPDTPQRPPSTARRSRIAAQTRQRDLGALLNHSIRPAEA